MKYVIQQNLVICGLYIKYTLFYNMHALKYRTTRLEFSAQYEYLQSNTLCISIQRKTKTYQYFEH